LLWDFSKLRNNHTILELGCGTGLVIEVIRDSLPSAVIVGIDQSKEMLNRILEKQEIFDDNKITFWHGDIRDTLYLDIIFDRVISRMAIHHVLTDTQNVFV
jgi:ubiquinone/menaquinone biosynthesis C-methylase UbiE